MKDTGKKIKKTIGGIFANDTFVTAPPNIKNSQNPTIGRQSNTQKKWANDVNRYVSKEDIWILNKHIKMFNIIKKMKLKPQ